MNSETDSWYLWLFNSEYDYIYISHGIWAKTVKGNQRTIGPSFKYQPSCFPRSEWWKSVPEKWCQRQFCFLRLSEIRKTTPFDPLWDPTCEVKDRSIDFTDFICPNVPSPFFVGSGAQSQFASGIRGICPWTLLSQHRQQNPLVSSEKSAAEGQND